MFEQDLASLSSVSLSSSSKSLSLELMIECKLRKESCKVFMDILNVAPNELSGGDGEVTLLFGLDA